MGRLSPKTTTLLEHRLSHLTVDVNKVYVPCQEISMRAPFSSAALWRHLLLKLAAKAVGDVPPMCSLWRLRKGAGSYSRQPRIEWVVVEIGGVGDRLVGWEKCRFPQQGKYGEVEYSIWSGQRN
jgi:hypothetical protein